MTITFFTNFINHHQVPLADEFYNLIGSNYTMVTFEPLPDEFKKRGYEDFSHKEYHLPAFASCEYLRRAEDLALNSDVVILGAAPDYLIQSRLKANKLTFRYEERIFKKIDRRIFHLHFWKKLYNQHTKYRYKNLHMLGASAFNRLDTALLLSYPNKCYKWGYFINVPHIDIQNTIKLKRGEICKILWCGTISQVKRPDLAVKLAALLKENQIDFQLNMIGSGNTQWTTLLNDLIVSLNVQDKVTLLGNLPNNQVMKLMQEHHIFIFTSDRGEGWGVVLNEAMANGCAVVASNKIGAAPFLIKQKQNGILFQSGNLSSLFESVRCLIENESLRESISFKAFNTIKETWSPKSAAMNFISLVNALQLHKCTPITEGPCSKSYIVNSSKILKQK